MEGNIWILAGGAVIFLLVIIFLLCIRRQKKRWIRKIPTKLTMVGCRIVYTDQKEEHKQKDIVYSQILHANQFDLQGKPDYIFQNKYTKAYIPVEIKSGSIGEEGLPHKGDFLQLAAYFLIVEEVYHKRPKIGFLMYRDYMFKIRNTSSVRKEVIQTMVAMRKMLKTGVEEVSPGFAKCRYCICNHTVCEFCEPIKESRKKG